MHDHIWRRLLGCDVALLQETVATVDDFTFLAPHLRTHVSAHSQRTVGSSMASISHADCTVQPLLDRPHFQWYSVTKSGLPTPIFVCNVHMPPDSARGYTSDKLNAKWAELIESATSYLRQGHIVVAGDLNSNTPPYKTTQPRNTRKLAELLAGLDLVNLTTLRRCRKPSHRSRSHDSLNRLDHILCDKALASMCTSYFPIRLDSISTSLSDHSPLICTFSLPLAAPQRQPQAMACPSFRWQQDRASAFAKVFASYTDDISSVASLADAGDVDAADALLSTMLLNAGLSSGMVRDAKNPRAPAKPRNMFRHKLTPEASAARATLKGLLQRPRACPDTIKAARRAFRKALRRGRRTTGC